MRNNSWFDKFPGIFSTECDLEFNCQKPKCKISSYFKHRSESGVNQVMFFNQNLKGVKMYEFEVFHIWDDKYQKSISDLCWRHIVCTVSRVTPSTWTKYTLTWHCDISTNNVFPKFKTSMIPSFQPSFTVFTLVLEVSQGKDRQSNVSNFARTLKAVKDFCLY